MAKRDTSKRRSVDQENWVASQYNGKVSPSSGGAVTDRGDVRTERQLIECKYIGLKKVTVTTEWNEEKRGFDLETVEKPSKSIRIDIEDLEKICDEAWHEGREPVMQIQVKNPESPLANDKGLINITVRMTSDDVYRNDIVDGFQDSTTVNEAGI